MAEEAAEISKRVQAVVATLYQKQADLVKAKSDAARIALVAEKLEKDVEQVRTQLSTELAKLDPAGSWKRA